MTPTDCDLRGAAWMPLHGHRLFNSELYCLAVSNPRAGLAALKLWWVAWQQCPAGSLPNDDRALARFADFGNDLRGWRRAREIAMHGFVLCNDGRYYHPLICAEALVSAARKVGTSERQKRHRSRLKEQNSAEMQPPGCQPAVTRLSAGCQPAAELSEPELTNALNLHNLDPEVTRYETVTSRATVQYNTEEGRKSTALLTGATREDRPPADPDIAAMTRVFSETRIEAHGAAGECFPTHDNPMTARRILAAVDQAAIARADALEICEHVFRAKHARRAAAGSSPISSMKFLENAVLEALAEYKRPAAALPPPSSGHSKAARTSGRYDHLLAAQQRVGLGRIAKTIDGERVA